MKRFLAILLALSLVAPQAVLAGPAPSTASRLHVAQTAPSPPIDFTASADTTKSQFVVMWTSPSTYFQPDFDFHVELNGSAVAVTNVETTNTVGGVTTGMATISASNATTNSPNTIRMRVHDIANNEYSPWVATSANYKTALPSLTMTVTGGDTTVTLGDKASATVIAPAGKSYAVGYAPQGDLERLSQVATFTGGTNEYSFEPTATGQVVALFAEDAENADTNAWSNVYVVVAPTPLPSLPLTVTGGGTVMKGVTATATVSLPAGKQVVVGYLVPGQQLSQVTTLTGPNSTYSFVPQESGRVEALFLGDNEFAPTTALSDLFTIQAPPLPSLPVTITGGNATVSYGTTQTVGISVPASVTVTVGYLVNGSTTLSQVKTFTENGPFTYSFKASGSGRVVVRFAGNDQFAETEAMSSVFTVRPTVSTCVLSASRVGINKTFKATAYMRPRQANNSHVVFRAYHLEKQSDGVYIYILSKTVTATVSDASSDRSRLSASMTLPSLGRWRVVAYYTGSNQLENAQGFADVITVEPVIGRTVAPSSALLRRNFTVTATIKPHQGTNQYVQFRCYHRERQRNGSFKYVLRKIAVPQIATIDGATSRLTARLSLPSRGNWRILASYKGSPYVYRVDGPYDTIIIR